MAKAEEYIIVNGVKMTKKEWINQVVVKQKERRGKKRFLDLSKPKKVEKKAKEISIIAEQIEGMIKQMTALKSVQVFKTHAYKSWGTISNDIFAHKGISRPMAQFCVSYGELNSLLKDIQEMAKKNEKAAYQYVEKMVWKLDDMKQNIIDIIKATESSGVCERFKNHEAIYGKGRQLGLQTVVTKALKTIGSLEETMKTLQQIADNGIDPFKYGDHMSIKAKARCWA